MYCFSLKLEEEFDVAVEKVTKALQAEKFGVLGEINVHDVFKNKMDIEIPPYRILNACNPSLAHRLVSHDADIGSLLPCNVLLRAEKTGGTSVVFLDPVTVFGLSSESGVKTVAEEAKAELMKVFERLK